MVPLDACGTRAVPPRARVAWLLSVIIGLCAMSLGCGGPTDPSDPAKAEEVQVIERWLKHLEDGEDRQAIQVMEGLPEDWDETKLGLRVDRLGLREVGERTWTAARYLRPKPNPNRNALEEAFVRGVLTRYPLAVEADFEMAGRKRAFWVKVLDGKLGSVRLDDTHFVPRGPRIVTRPAVDEPAGPVVRGAQVDRHDVGKTSFLRVRSSKRLPKEASAKVTADCRYGEAVFRHSIVSSLRDNPLSLSARLRDEAPSRCQVLLEMTRAPTFRQSRTWCWTANATKDGPCAGFEPEEPPSAPAVVTRVVPRGDDYTLDYDLLLGAELPPNDDEESASLHLELKCDPKTHRVSRPLYEKEHPVGIRRTYGALFNVPTDSISFPCDLGIAFQVQSPFKKERTTVYEGCATRDEVRPKACP